ncbi:MAG: glycosyltransferase [Burkholderiaceae bacterium]|nr:glycosyltransferase [Burkholderiaceae bacterium]
MRVLQLGRFWNDDHGGVERHAALLSRSLAERGVDVVNLVAAAEGEPGSERLLDGYRLVQARCYGMFARTAVSPQLVWKALALHREKPFDVVHLHFPDPLSHLVGLVMPRSVKRVITWHSDIVRNLGLLALYLPFLRAITRSADALVAATQAHFDASQQVPRDIPASRLHLIPYGLDYGPLELAPATRALMAQLNERAAGRKIVFALGRHVYYKGFGVLLEAARSLDAMVIIGGSGPLSAELRLRAAELGIADKVFFPGRIPEDQLAAYFNACDVFTLPSIGLTEGFGLVQLEAMACGKPVVCSQLGNGVNVVNRDGETGLSVPPGDAAALAGALAGLLGDDALRERLGAQARDWARTGFSLESMGQSHLNLYQQLLEPVSK